MATADLEISGDTDGLFVDANRQRLYVFCGEGFIDVIEKTALRSIRTQRHDRQPLQSADQFLLPEARQTLPRRARTRRERC